MWVDILTGVRHAGRYREAVGLSCGHAGRHVVRLSLRLYIESIT